jgi:hypothetical protein
LRALALIDVAAHDEGQLVEHPAALHGESEPHHRDQKRTTSAAVSHRCELMLLTSILSPRVRIAIRSPMKAITTE